MVDINTATTENSVSGCPVRKEDRNGSSPSSFRAWLGLSSSNKSTKLTPIGAPKDQQSQCPMKESSLPASVEETLQHNQRPIFPDQAIPLSTHRVVSSIPKSDSVSAPAHQNMPRPNFDRSDETDDKSSSNWVYPSEQQFYNAMRKKGWSAPNEEDMATVIKIHNAVNEQSWKEVKRWEKELNGCDNPKLVRFMGRPKDLSPKAWIYSNLFLYKPPFDRHDWFVESTRKESNNTKEEVILTRYVIDFYDGKSTNSSRASDTNLPPIMSPVSMYLDVRPALDHPQNFVDRAKMAIKDMLPGIFPPTSP